MTNFIKINRVLLALLALPLMFSCKPKNGPDDPNNPENQPGTEEWFEKWTEESNPEYAVTVQESNLTGLWQLKMVSWVKNGDSILSWSVDFEFNAEERSTSAVQDMYLQLMSDHKMLFHIYSDHSNEGIGKTTYEKREGTWSLSGKTLTIEGEMHGYRIDNEKNIFTVKVLENERLVITTPFMDMEEEGLTYEAFARVAELPAVPVDKTVPEVMLSSKWKVVCDSITRVDSKHESEQDKGDGKYDYTTIQKNKYTGYTFEFKAGADTTLVVSDVAGKVIDTYTLSAIGKPDAWFFLFNLHSDKNVLGLDKQNTFYHDFNNPPKTWFTCAVDYEKPTAGYDHTRDYFWFEFEAVK